MRKVILAAVILMFLFGCGKKVNMFVVGYIQRGQQTDLHYWGGQSGYIYSDPDIEQLTVFINEDSTNVVLPQGLNLYASFSDPDTVPPTVGIEYKFDIKTNLGNATATCTLPGDYDFTYPQDKDTVPANTALIITWNTAAGADWYYLDVQYEDSAYTYWKDTTVTTDSTSWTLPAVWIKDKGRLWINLNACNGPKVEPGAAGNVNGAKGYCIAINTRQHTAYVGSSFLAASKIQPKVGAPKEFIMKYLRDMSKYNDDAAEMLELMK
jgi:hypothetical protein